MTFANFKTLVANFAQRDKSLFDSPAVAPLVDKLAWAINAAKDWAQQVEKFELSKALVDITVDRVAGGALSTAVLHGTATPVTIRSLDRAFVQATGGGSLVPIRLSRRGALVEAVGRGIEDIPLEERRTETTFPSGFTDFEAYQIGTNVFLYPWSDTLLGSSTVVSFDVLSWLPDLSADGDTNFLLTYCQSWLLLKSLTFLNIFLKDSERVVVDNKQLENEWDAVRIWNHSLIDTSAPITLD